MRRQLVGKRHLRLPVAEDGDKVLELLPREAAAERNLLDIALAQIARETDERRSAARQPRSVDDDLVVDEADDDAVRVLQRLLRRGDEVVDAALHQGMVGRVQIRAAHRGGDSADEIFCPGLVHQRP